MKIIMTPKAALRLVAALSLANGLFMARFLLDVEKTMTLTTRRAEFLADIVQRNFDRLEDFDLIALKQLGILREEES